MTDTGDVYSELVALWDAADLVWNLLKASSTLDQLLILSCVHHHLCDRYREVGELFKMESRFIIDELKGQDS